MAFDVNQFLSTKVEAEMDDSFTPVPEGEYRVSIDDIDAKAGTAADRNSVMLTLKLKVHDEEIAKLMGRDPYIWNYLIFLDVDENWQLTYGANQNIQLGQIRAALGMNKANVPFSLGDLIASRDMIVKVQQKKDKEDKIRSNIIAWARAD